MLIASVDVTASCDVEAIQRSLAFSANRYCELWAGERLVAFIGDPQLVDECHDDGAAKGLRGAWPEPEQWKSFMSRAHQPLEPARA
jgi:hypothetical protein